MGVKCECCLSQRHLEKEFGMIVLYKIVRILTCYHFKSGMGKILLDC